MAKAMRKREKKMNFENLSQKDIDILSLLPRDVMKKYKLEKQPVYDRKFALNKKIKAAGLTVEQVLSKTGHSTEVITEAKPKKVPSKQTAVEKKALTAEDKPSNSRELMVIDKPVPVVMKPIAINFDNFSIKLNGVPRSISINPETNAVEIDL